MLKLAANLKSLNLLGFFIIFTPFLIAGCGSENIIPPTQAQQKLILVPKHKTLLGFTPWPPDLSNSAVNRAYEFINKNANIIAHHFDNGVPWEQALNGDRFPPHLQQDWQKRKAKSPKHAKIFLALTPLDFGRAEVARSWTNKGDNQVRKGRWANKRLNDPEVKKAFLNYARRAIAFYKPSYLAVAIEANIIISKNPRIWNDFLELNKFVYSNLKAENPKLPVFATVQYEHLRGIEAESAQNADKQHAAVKQLMKHSDMMAISTYRYGVYHPNPMKPDYFAIAESFGKPVTIAETGAMSSPVVIMGNRLAANEKDQMAFMSGLLKHATRKKYPFVINWVPIDFDPMLKKLPHPVKEIAKAWVHNGLKAANGKNKPALAIWQSYLQQYSEN